MHLKTVTAHIKMNGYITAHTKSLLSICKEMKLEQHCRGFCSLTKEVTWQLLQNLLQNEQFIPHVSLAHSVVQVCFPINN